MEVKKNCIKKGEGKDGKGKKTKRKGIKNNDEREGEGERNCYKVEKDISMKVKGKEKGMAIK